MECKTIVCTSFLFVRFRLQPKLSATIETDDTIAGIAALESFIKEIGLPTRWSEIGVTDEAMLRKAADSAVLTAGCTKQFT